MPTVIVFTENNARFIHNPEDLDKYRFMPNAAIDPDLSNVKDTPPHLWKLQSGKIVKMSSSEIECRETHIQKHGAINKHDSKALPASLGFCKRWITKLLPTLLSILIGIALQKWIL